MNDIQAPSIELDHSQPKVIQNEQESIESAIHKLLDDSNTHIEIKQDAIGNFDIEGRLDELDDEGAIAFGEADVEVNGKGLSWEALFEDELSTGLFDVDAKDSAVVSVADMSGETLTTPTYSTSGGSRDNTVTTMTTTEKRPHEDDDEDKNENPGEIENLGSSTIKGAPPSLSSDAHTSDTKRLKTNKSEISTASDVIKSHNDPFMSPISLSPSNSTSSEGTDLRMKLDTIPIISSTSHRHQRKTSTSVKKGKEDTRHKSQLTEAVFKQISAPELFTNEFTMLQVSEMKKRIINTHKLLLNFNYLKDGYARTCVELKKTLNCLKNSEIHRAHLLVENERLKKKIHELLNDYRIEGSIEGTYPSLPPRPASVPLPVSQQSLRIDVKKEDVLR